MKLAFSKMTGLQKKQETCHHQFSELKNYYISDNILKAYLICRFNTIMFSPLKLQIKQILFQRNSRLDRHIKNRGLVFEII